MLAIDESSILIHRYACLECIASHEIRSPQAPWSPHAAHDPQSTIPQPPDAFKFHPPPPGRPQGEDIDSNIRRFEAPPTRTPPPENSLPVSARALGLCILERSGGTHIELGRVGVGVLGELDRLGRGLAPAPKHELDVVRAAEHGPVARALSSPCGRLGLGLVLEPRAFLLLLRGRGRCGSSRFWFRFWVVVGSGWWLLGERGA